MDREHQVSGETTELACVLEARFKRRWKYLHPLPSPNQVETETRLHDSSPLRTACKRDKAGDKEFSHSKLSVFAIKAFEIYCLSILFGAGSPLTRIIFTFTTAGLKIRSSIAPGKPVQNAFADSFIGRLRGELLGETCSPRSRTPAVLEAGRPTLQNGGPPSLRRHHRPTGHPTARLQSPLDKNGGQSHGPLSSMQTVKPSTSTRKMYRLCRSDVGSGIKTI